MNKKPDKINSSTKISLFVFLVILIAGISLVLMKSFHSSIHSISNQPTAVITPIHCGGNTANPVTCPPGYACKADPNTALPFGDVGGICQKVQ